ncbi:hypothetical protein [Sphingomonas alpina]|uniref:DUF3471 domain-containing protein n=1 Tax=Sphingomonas alpina TaxID=653931 RepID=A0A7H0LFS6_9SPHN|nr:hypothetical protein [Sphingomonas alpina]QNQ08529.1 hypothetical protein H3Z74_17510 [Sphingomonas alpina]
MKLDSTKLLMIYSAVLTTAFAVSLGGGGAVAQSGAKTSFDTIDVKRINVREDDGTLRMIVSNTSRSPGIIYHGKERPHPSGNRGAGIIFYNSEGTENGGLTFGGETGKDGKVSGSGHLSFDQYQQDQVIQLTQSEYDGRRWAAMIVNDRPETPLDFDLAEKLGKMPAGAERDAFLKKLEADGVGGRQRLFVGKTRNRDSAVMLSDALGRPRMMLKVTNDGAASIDFLDENGKVQRSLAATDKQ